jgi:hypothetical protein
MLVALGVLTAGAVGAPDSTGNPGGRTARAVAGQERAAPDRAGPTSELIALSYDSDSRQQVTLIDPRTRVMAVYHVDRATGALSLKSVRNVHWDLQIEDFNSANPTPREIRALTEPR